MNSFYILLFLILVIECVLFVIITISPKPLQKFIVGKLYSNAKTNAFWKIHLIACLILILFYIDLHFTEDKFEDEKRDLQMRGSYMASGTLHSKI